MPKTVFITGTSSGIGKATAHYFFNRGWNVVATVRNSGTNDLPNSPQVFSPVVDVTKPDSLDKAVKETLKKFGAIDVLVNNAGYGIEGPFESFTSDEVRGVFDTNFFGTLLAVRSVLPAMKKRKSGIIITISSMGGRLAIPFYTTYHASKWAVEGFYESLQYELRYHGIMVKLIEPGIVRTDFFQKMAQISNKPFDNIYKSSYGRLLKRKTTSRRFGANPVVVAKTVYKAATDGSHTLRYIAGFDAYIQHIVHTFLPEQWIFGLIKLFS